MRKDPFHGIITSFLTLATLLRAKFDETAGDFKASAPQVLLVSHVLAAKEITLTQVAACMKISVPGARAKVAELAANGIVRVTGDGCDGIIRVTPRGRIWHRDVNMAYQSRLRQVFAALPPPERIKVQHAFDAVIASMTGGR